jgi:cell fate (sporulation/competence/biofilm development) regulator YmcA (YheA/YmcA/DUF963 family)
MLCKLQDAVNFELQKLRAFEDSEFSIEEIKAEISKTDLKEALTDLFDGYSQIAEEEREKFDNLSENLQQSSKAESYTNNAEIFESAADDVSSCINEIENFDEDTVLSELICSIEEVVEVEGE